MFTSLGALLTQVAKKFPSKVAVEEEGKQISYQELDSYSHKIASYLLSMGDLSPDDKVGLYINKSINGIAAFFGILKAGCAYVPLDLNWPPKRCAYIIDECRIKYLFSHSHYAGRVSEISKLSSCLKNTIFLDKDASGVESVSLRSLPDIGKDSLAVVFYTSGSTGKPKGVMKTHQAEIRHLAITTRSHRKIAYSISKNDRHALYYPFSFCGSLTDMLLMIQCAATICILPEGTCSFVLTFKESIRQKRVTILKVGSELLRWLVLHGDLSCNEFPDLRMIIFSGSNFPPKYLHFLMNTLPKVKYLQNYGSTEAGIVTYYPVRKQLLQKQAFIPIGKPGIGIRSFIADEKGRRLKEKLGVEGELYIDSPALMLGYLNDPQATQSALFKDPFTGTHRFVYRSGDLVRIDREGNYIYLGRCDNMVKVRGFRVNLEEIESVLQKHPKIKEAVCLGVPDEEMGNRIKAVVVLKGGESAKDEELKSFCRDYLATYMVPESFDFKDSLPWTPSAKIDRVKIYKEVEA